MSAHPFDLNMKNYSDKELQEMLELPLNYDETTLKIQSNTLRQNITNNHALAPNIKIDTIQFLDEVEKKLAQKQKATAPIPTSAQSNDLFTLKSSEIIDAGDTSIIKQEPARYTFPYPSEYFAGAMNPLVKRIMQQNLNIDTRFRDNYFTTPSTNFHVDLPILLTDVVSLHLRAFQLPTTFYNISKIYDNNYFVIKIADHDQLLITLPDGNYTTTGFTTYINEILTNAANPYNDLKITYDASSSLGGSGRILFENSGLTDTIFTLNFLTDKYGNDCSQEQLQLKLGWIMGFRNGVYKGESSYVSEGELDLFGIRYLYLVVDDFNNNVNNSFFGAFNSSMLNKNILAQICLSGSFFTLATQNNLNIITTPRIYFGPVNISKLHIQLLDEFGRIIDLNNMDFSFLLSYQTIYQL